MTSVEIRDQLSRTAKVLEIPPDEFLRRWMDKQCVFCGAQYRLHNAQIDGIRVRICRDHAIREIGEKDE